MGIEAPIPISTKLGDLNNVFRRIVSAAEHPHLSIPETEAGRSRKQYHRLINRSLMFVSGMTWHLWNLKFLIFWHLMSLHIWTLIVCWVYKSFLYLSSNGFALLIKNLFYPCLCLRLVSNGWSSLPWQSSFIAM